MSDVIDHMRLAQHIWVFQDMGLILMTSGISIYGHGHKRDKVSLWGSDVTMSHWVISIYGHLDKLVSI